MNKFITVTDTASQVHHVNINHIAKYFAVAIGTAHSALTFSYGSSVNLTDTVDDIDTKIATALAS